MADRAFLSGEGNSSHILFPLFRPEGIHPGWREGGREGRMDAWEFPQRAPNRATKYSDDDASSLKIFLFTLGAEYRHHT